MSDVRQDGAEQAARGQHQALAPAVKIAIMDAATVSIYEEAAPRWQQWRREANDDLRAGPPFACWRRPCGSPRLRAGAVPERIGGLVGLDARGAMLALARARSPSSARSLRPPRQPCGVYVLFTAPSSVLSADPPATLDQSVGLRAGGEGSASLQPWTPRSSRPLSNGPLRGSPRPRS